MKEIQAHKILAALEKWCAKDDTTRTVLFGHGPTEWFAEMADGNDVKDFRGVSLQDALAQAAQVAGLEDS